MGRFLRLTIVVTALLFTMACFLTECGGGGNNNIIDPTPTVVSLVVQAQPNTYNTVGQVIALNYIVTNTGTSRLAGPVVIADDRAIVVSCPNLNTVGNNNNDLENGESITCTGGYTITQADLSSGAVTFKSSATVGGQTSATVSTDIRAQLNRVLTIAVTASPLTYSAANQTITYTYVVTNTGTTPLGPAQFVVTDNKIINPVNCGANNTTLAPSQNVTCTAVYTTTAADMSSSSIANTAIATGAGAGTIQPAGTVVTNTVITPIPGQGGNPNYTPGTTVQHTVQENEWLLQISRCYGANYDAVQRANPLVKDPNVIFPVQVVTVPNIGSNGTIYGPKDCVILYTVVSGDSWQSIANKYNADIEVLQAANVGKSITPGVKIKVPNNSRQSGGIYATPVPQPTLTPKPTTIPIRQPIRLTFPAGSPAVVNQSGTIGTPDTIPYVFNATAGQILTIRLTVPTNDVGFAVYGPNNATIKPLDTVTSWSGTLVATGDHFINLVSSVGAASKSYTLEVTLATPVPASATERVADINPGSGSSNPSHLSPYNGQLYFQAAGNDGAGPELWKYDAGLKAASRVVDIYPGTTGSEPGYLRPFKDNMLYFNANGNDGAGRELWRFNGSAAGRVNDLYSGLESSNPSYMTEFNGMLYFSANGNDGAGVELWRFDGVTSTRAADINQGAGNSNPSYLAVFNNALYFSATTTNGGTELWKFDGSTATIAADITPELGNSNPAFLVSFNNALYFSANSNNGAGTELWRFDGTSATMASDINPGAADSAPTYMTVFNNVLYFSAVGNNAGFELWKFDGTTPSLVADINPMGNSNPSYLTVYSNELYFQATGNDGAGTELWKYKGP